MQELDRLLKQVSIGDELNGSFENAVFSKIKKKKMHRRVAVATSVVFGIMGFLFGFFLSTPNSQPQGPLHAGNQTHQVETIDKEEIPVLEDVYFSSYDSQSNYAVETVAYQEDEGGI